jgi:hypothetical protein
VDLARDPCVRANLETQPWRIIERFGFERVPVVNQSFVMQIVGIFALVESAGISSEIPYRLDYVLLFDFFDDLFCLLLLRDGLSKLIEFDVGHSSLTLGHMQ